MTACFARGRTLCHKREGSKGLWLLASLAAAPLLPHTTGCESRKTDGAVFYMALTARAEHRARQKLNLVETTPGPRVCRGIMDVQTTGGRGGARNPGPERAGRFSDLHTLTIRRKEEGWIVWFADPPVCSRLSNRV